MRFDRLWRRAVCRVIGHSLEYMDPYETACCRCGFEPTDDKPVRDDTGFYLLYYRWTGRLRLRVFRHWLTCPDCGARFGRHKSNCMPF